MYNLTNNTTRQPRDFLMPKISVKLKRGHPNVGAKCRCSRLNTGAVAENWRLSMQNVVNFGRKFVTLCVHPICLQHVVRVCQRQLILVVCVGLLVRDASDSICLKRTNLAKY